MDIKVFIPQGEIIPTKMRLTVDGKQVHYERVHDGFGYDFSFFSGDTEAEATAIATELARIMSHQSYDHGSEWRVASIETVPQEERYAIGITVRAMFRIKDSY